MNDTIPACQPDYIIPRFGPHHRALNILPRPRHLKYRGPINAKCEDAMYAPPVLRNHAESPSAPFFSTHQESKLTIAGGAELAATRNTAVRYEGGNVVKRAQRSWAGVGAVVSDVRCNGRMSVVLESDRTLLSATLEEAGACLEIRGETGSSEIAAKPGPLSVIPAGLGAHGQATGISFVRHLVLELDVSFLFAMLDDDTGFSDVFTPRFMFSDPRVLHLAHLFAEECAADAPRSRLYGDSLSVALLLALAGPTAAGGTSLNRGGLARWQLRRVTDYFRAHLAEDFDLQNAADLVKLSRSYFSRAFKISSGLSPYQWVLQARIAKAKQLLLEADLPLAQIALRLGFADQSHFTRTFVRMTRQSPRAWQRTHCSLNGRGAGELLQQSAEAEEIWQ